MGLVLGGILGLYYHSNISESGSLYKAMRFLCISTDLRVWHCQHLEDYGEDGRVCMMSGSHWKTGSQVNQRPTLGPSADTTIPHLRIKLSVCGLQGANPKPQDRQEVRSEPL